MKLSAIAAIVASAGLVAATPIRVVIASAQQDGSEVVENLRFGHAVPISGPPPPAVATWKAATTEGAQVGAAPVRKPCRGRMSRMRQKSVEVSNAFRQFLGLPLIDAHPHPHHVAILPVGAPFIHPEGQDPPSVVEYKVIHASNSSIDRPHHRHGKFPHHQMWKKQPFTERLNHALLHLGRWEGRAVAFVLGCGIGVLLRLVWVLGIVMYRAVRGRRGDDHEYTEVAFIEEYDEPAMQSPPPIYVYPVDEKVAIRVDEDPKAPSATEGSH
ncbi:hypothetical protein CVT26_004231 [Gymnopilus dilepis]|uniref:Uncharacterized protein n=1 Tax=Gymnopilus dilepis TaxID=231916 RepID=A0A409YN22_9AGAR|nr:hypothetical protein CVT26_004231 [Gymnopilus dilepis]